MTEYDPVAHVQRMKPGTLFWALSPKLNEHSLWERLKYVHVCLFYIDGSSPEEDEQEGYPHDDPWNEGMRLHEVAPPGSDEDCRVRAMLALCPDQVWERKEGLRDAAAG